MARTRARYYVGIGRGPQLPPDHPLAEKMKLSRPGEIHPIPRGASSSLKETGMPEGYASRPRLTYDIGAID
jgi:hypothetical protein